MNIADNIPDVIVRPYVTDYLGREAANLTDEERMGILIRIRRRDLNLSQNDVAHALGVTRPLVTQWESGKSRVMTKDISRLADVLQVSPSFFFNVPRVPLINLTQEEAEAVHQRGFLTSLIDRMTADQRDDLIRSALEILGKNEVAV